MMQLFDTSIEHIPHRIALTGGPLAGKSTVMEFLRQNYSHKAEFMTEVASMLLSNGYPQPGRDIDYSESWLDYINKVILPTQLNMENGHLHAAQAKKKPVIFFDRGLLDPAAFMDGGKQVLVEKYGLDLESLHHRYSMVIHIESLACINPDAYNQLQGTNPSRYDTAETAIQRDKALIEAWKDHPNWHFVSADGGIDAVLQRVIDLLAPILDVEIERKWIVTSEAASFIAELPSEKVKQYYLRLPREQTELRLRKIGDKHFITAKSGEGFKRTEWEQLIPSHVFDFLVVPSMPHISKTRHYMWHDDNKLEIDVYDRPEGLITIECEFNSEYDANKFKLPDVFYGCSKDVTDVLEYKNYYLAMANSP
jgi:CYTH domain-containing protein